MYLTNTIEADAAPDLRASAEPITSRPRSARALSARALPVPRFPANDIPHPGPAGGRLYRSGGKRMLDVALVLMMAPVALPVIGLFALLSWLSGGAPFYWQDRLGRDGRVFRLVKLRTMVRDADARLADHLESDPAARAEWLDKQKLAQDPRITPLGRVMRCSSIDELPQLWNVLKGEMSLIGPRPMMVDQKALYPGLAYYDLRPGITGPWQVSARNKTSFAERAAFDTEYGRRLSLWADIVILVRTVGVVLRCTGC